MGDPAAYRIRVRSELDAGWAWRFEGMRVVAGHGETVLEGPVPDQAALHRLLSLVRDMGLTLLSVQREEPREHHHEGM